MPIESATYISDLNAANPLGTDQRSTVDDHLRLIKSTVKATLPNLTGAVTPTHTELNYMAGVTSAVQTQLNAKQPRATRIDVASVAGTVDLTTNAPNTDDIRITGALTITAFTVVTDRVIRVTASAAHTLTNNAAIVTNTGSNIVVASGDTYMLRATAANTVEVFGYMPALVSPAKLSQPLTRMASVSLSGTSTDLTGIPSWVSRVTLVIKGMSTNGTSNPLIQLGSGGISASGYASSGSALNGSGTSQIAYTTGIGVNSSAAATVLSGSIVLTHQGSNVWIVSGTLSNSIPGNNIVGGDKTLTGALDAIRLTTVAGVDTFDAGSISALYE